MAEWIAINRRQVRMTFWPILDAEGPDIPVHSTHLPNSTA
jgi:hypothetical protein